MKNIKPLHKMITRRDFVAQGVEAALCYMAMPSALGLFKSPLALGCDPLSGNSLVPFLVFDCVGGIGLSGNWLALDQAENLFSNLSAYRRMAILDPNNHTTEYGLPLVRSHGDPSQGFCGFYNSLSNGQLISAAARSRFRVGSFAARSTDDTSANLHHPGLLCLQSVMAAGGGKLYAGGFSDQISHSGGYQSSPIVKETHQFLGAYSRTDLINGLSYGLISGQLNSSERDILARYLGRLSESQLSRLGNLNFREQFKQILSCGLNQNIDRTEVNPSLDPLNDADTVSVFRLAQNIFNASKMDRARRENVATVVYNTLMGNCAGGAIAFGSCDYHNNEMPGSDRHGDLKDEEVAATLALCVELAHRKNKPLFIAIVSDGSVACNDEAFYAGQRRWTSDSDSHAMALVCAYNPSGPLPMLRKQVGYYNVVSTSSRPPSVGAETSTLVGNNPSNVAHAIYANYLALNFPNIESEFLKFVDPERFDASKINDVLIFARK